MLLIIKSEIVTVTQESRQISRYLFLSHINYSNPRGQLPCYLLTKHYNQQEAKSQDSFHFTYFQDPNSCSNPRVKTCSYHVTYFSDTITHSNPRGKTVTFLLIQDIITDRHN